MLRINAADQHLTAYTHANIIAILKHCKSAEVRLLAIQIGPLRLQSRGLESLKAGLQFLRLANRLKPWLRTLDGLRWLMVASHGLRVQTRKLTAANSTFSFHINVSHLLFGPGPKILAKQVRGSRASAGLQVKWRQVVK